MRIYTIIFLLFFVGSTITIAQSKDSVMVRFEDKIKRSQRKELHDSLFSNTINLETVIIESASLRSFNSPKLQKRYNKLVAHVKKVYPYAKQAGDLLKAEEANMVGMSEKARKAHMKQVEKNIEKKFSKELKALTFTQGRVLLKLIDRETGHTSYDLVDDLRGSFRAWFYNGIAGLFGYNLKSRYEPQKYAEDKYIEEIVRMIEKGQLSLR